MTLESIDLQIQKLQSHGRIVLFDPRLRPHEAYRRRLWLHPLVEKWVSTREGSEEDREFFAGVRAFLKDFVIGADFDDDAKLKAISQGRDGLWSLRIAFQPQHRILGGFLRPGEFVATNFRSRQRLNDETWIPTLTRSRQIWSSLFSHKRLSGYPRSYLLSDFRP